MLEVILRIYQEAGLQVIRTLTGQLFTEDQIKLITKHSLGQHLEALFPDNQEELDRANRISIAQDHILNASKIMAEMRVELDAQAQATDLLAAEIKQKKQLAKEYAALADSNQDAASAMRMEIEQSINQELKRQSLQGRTTRRIASAILWSITLILGAALGAYFPDVVSYVVTHVWPWAKSFFSGGMPV